MRKLAFILLSLLFCSLSAFPQSRQVRVTTKKGSVFEGSLKEFKAFEHLIVEVNGKNLLIPYETMAYIDDITPKAVSSKEKNNSKESRKKGNKKSKNNISKEDINSKESRRKGDIISKEDFSAQRAVPTPSLPVSLEKTPSSSASPAQGASPFKGFLLSPGNNVYLHCTSDPSDPSFDAAALDVLKRQFRRYNFWTVVDNPAEAHFAINYTLQLQGSAKTVLSISSDRTATQETLGTAKGPEDTDDYRKIVYELFQKYLLPLQTKISKNTPPKRTQRLFTLE